MLMLPKFWQVQAELYKCGENKAKPFTQKISIAQRRGGKKHFRLLLIRACLFKVRTLHGQVRKWKLVFFLISSVFENSSPLSSPDLSSFSHCSIIIFRCKCDDWKCFFKHPFSLFKIIMKKITMRALCCCARPRRASKSSPSFGSVSPEPRPSNSFWRFGEAAEPKDWARYQPSSTRDGVEPTCTITLGSLRTLNIFHQQLLWLGACALRGTDSFKAVFFFSGNMHVITVKQAFFFLNH